MLFILSLLISSQAWAVDVQCVNFEYINQGRLPHNVSLSCDVPGQTERRTGYVNRTTVPATVSFRMPNGSEKTLTNPRCDGSPCTLEMIRNYRQFTSLANILQIDPNHRYEVTGLSLSNAERIDLYSDWSSPRKTGTLAPPSGGGVILSTDADAAVAPVVPVVPVAPVAPVAPPPVVAPISTEAPLATNCKYRDRVVDGKDAAPSIVNIPGCSQKVCLAEARCDVDGRRRLVSVYCPAIGTENCPDATACANSEEFGTTVEALEVRELAPGARPQRAGGR